MAVFRHLFPFVRTGKTTVRSKRNPGCNAAGVTICKITQRILPQQVLLRQELPLRGQQASSSDMR